MRILAGTVLSLVFIAIGVWMAWKNDPQREAKEKSPAPSQGIIAP
jgi:prolipoprotein diacylglyceryltransferase